MARKEKKELCEMKKYRVAVIYGGPSREHEVSVKTGQAMIEGLDKDKYEVLPIFIAKSGEWKVDEENYGSDSATALEKIKARVDLCLIGLHGTFGEDGQIQRLLEDVGLPYTGSNSGSSELAMKKHLASRLYEKEGMYVPQEVAISEWSDEIRKEVLESLKLPVVVKPESQGSSVGVSIVDDALGIEDAVLKALENDSIVLIQQYIKGREVSCGVVEVEGEILALPPTEVMPVDSRFYDYDAKYIEGATKEITPPKNMSHKTIEAIQSNAVRAHKILGCSGYSRTDMIIEDDKIYVIETNTLPGMTVTSFLPQQVQAIGMPFSKLLDHIIHAALKGKSNV